MTDRRERPWRKLRVVVEVTVPPNSRAEEKDLKYAVETCLPKQVFLPRPISLDRYEATIRVKGLTRFWPAFLRLEKGLSLKYRKKTTDAR